MEKKPTNLLADKKLRKGSDDPDKIREPAKPLRVLIVDDVQEDAVLVLRELKRCGFDPSYERVDTAETMSGALQRRNWDIIISDYRMPRFSGPQAIALLKQSGLDIPCFVVSGTVGEETAAACMRAGASDYIMKDALARLAPAIERELREAQSRREKHLAEERFRQAQKTESVGRLAGGVARDFNNVLTAIMGYSNFLANGPAQNSTWREDVEEIRKASERAASLTRQLLAFSRRQALQPRVIDLNAEIVDIEKMLQRIMGDDVRWSTHLSPNLWHVKADPGQIQQVLMNLAVNARDAMPEGGKFTIRTENLELTTSPPGSDFAIQLGSYVVMSATDTGIGMDEETQTHIFEPFFTTKEKSKGTGLGLAMVYGVVKQSGGYISVDCKQGQGATFRLYLPRVQETLDTKAADKVLPKSLRGSETILVVDDDESVRSLLCRILSGNGYTVRMSSRSGEAMDLSRKQGPPQLLLTDIVLPDLNGMELAKQMTSLHPQLKVLYISGYLDRDFGHFVLDDKLSFLQKPFTAAALARMVREVLDAGTQPVGSAEGDNALQVRKKA